ncbi:MAG: dockerin type I domain-containing protein, partial [Candidatus Marinimicrobia bacterium]|nr:dockerin type I domain-containing protein [Candidatus Neomarinimicrobiota bacterium]
TKINNGYTSWSGSSMASPIAAGAIGLLRSFNMDWTNEMLETMILATADPVIYDINLEDYLQEKLGTGRVDALRSLSTDLFPRFEMVGSDFFLPNDASGIVSAGDALEVMVILLNDEDWGTAINISSILSAESEEISILNPMMYFDDAFPGMPIVNDSSPYEVELSSTIQPGEYEFILTLTANEVDGIGYEANFGFTLIVEQDSQLLLGDVNGDDTINILDIVMVANYTLGQAEFTDEQTQAADVNQDGTINILDIVQIINIALDT